MVDVKGLKAEPPPIFVSKQPALLVQTDGPPAFAPVKGKSGLSFLVNTNWDIFRVEEGGALYLRDDTRWLTASSLEVPWAPRIRPSAGSIDAAQRAGMGGCAGRRKARAISGRAHTAHRARFDCVRGLPFKLEALASLQKSPGEGLHDRARPVEMPA